MITPQQLKQIYLFKNVSDPVLELVAQAAEEVSFSAGEPIVSAREALDALYVIRSGSVRGTREGITAPVIFGTGQSFGQVSLLDGGPVGFDVVALEPVQAIALRASKLVEKLRGKPEAGFELFRAISRSLAGRLRSAMDAFALARDDAPGR